MDEKIESVHRIIDELGESVHDDVMGIREMLFDFIISNVEVVMKFKHYIMPKIQDLNMVFNSVKLDLDSTKKELAAREERLKSVTKCLKCPNLEKELIILRKKQSLNESRIKSIAKILTRQSPLTQISQVVIEGNEDSDENSVTKAFNLVSQVLGCEKESGPDLETDKIAELNCRKAGKGYKSRSSSFTNNASPSKKFPSVILDDMTAKETYDLHDGNANKENGIRLISLVKRDNKSPTSPVLGKLKNTPVRSSVQSSPTVVRNIEPVLDECHDVDYDDMMCIPPSPQNTSSNKKHTITPSSFCGPSKKLEYDNKVSLSNTAKTSMSGGSMKKADFWQLKTTPFVDLSTSALKKQGSKLKQAKLSLGCFPKKTELCDIKEFNGGIRASHTSTQLPSKESEGDEVASFKIPLKVQSKRPTNFAVDLKTDEDIVLASPQAKYSSNKRKGRKHSSGRRLSSSISSCEEQLNQSPKSESLETSRKNNDYQEEKLLDSSFDCIKKPSYSPKFKYRDGPVRKKHERQKLPGWDCDNCKKEPKYNSSHHG